MSSYILLVVTLEYPRVQSYPTDMSELELLSDLGNGTCGHVVKMRHIPTNHSFAVKVSACLLALATHILRLFLFAVPRRDAPHQHLCSRLRLL